MRVKALVMFVLGAVLAMPAFAQVAACVLTDQETEEVISGVILTWDSSFHCRNAPDRGQYAITVTVRNAVNSAQTVRIERLDLTHTTPRVRGQGPRATLDSVTGVPVNIPPGESRQFTLRGTYELIQTDEGKKANLHFQARGRGVATGEPFSLGINAHFRAPGVLD